MRYAKLLIVVVASFGIVICTAQGAETAPLRGSIGNARLCFNAWNEMVPCRTLSSSASEAADGVALRLWSDMDITSGQEYRFAPFFRWQHGRRWDAKWSLFAPAKDMGLNLAVNHGRPWMNMQMGKLEFNVEMDSFSDTQFYIGLDHRW